jgi:MoxR-like ATPase
VRIEGTGGRITHLLGRAQAPPFFIQRRLILRMNPDLSLSDFRDQALAFAAHCRGVILGQETAIRLITAAIFARGHVLLEGSVGVGKTTLLRTVARGLGGEYARVEGAIDLMPHDLVYYTYLDENAKPGVLPGPLLHYGETLSTFFFNEINRARPQVHALLLRVMAEGTVSAFNREYRFPHLQVFADRNRVEKEETFELPAAARDRFMLEIPMDAPKDRALLDRLMAEPRFHDTDALIQDMPWGILPLAQLNGIGKALQQQIFVSERLRAYALDLALATQHPEKFGIGLDEADLGEVMEAGASPRAMSHLLRLARVQAWLNGRDRVLPEDVQAVFGPVIAHRLVLKPVYEYRRAELVPALLAKILKGIAAP